MQVEAAFRRDRAIVLAALLGVTILAWIYMYLHASELSHAGHGTHLLTPDRQAWDIGDVFLLFVMWTVMMVGMMIPSASPMILMFATTNRRHREQGGAFVPTSLFVFGYIAVWALYSAIAALVQWGLHGASLMSPTMESASPYLSGALLVTAGVFQWTSLKYNCLSHCRSPLSFLMTEWRDGMSGAFVMGAKHGSYCVGCCWALMVVMFAVGIMNLLWAAMLTAYLLSLIHI